MLFANFRSAIFATHLHTMKVMAANCKTYHRLFHCAIFLYSTSAPARAISNSEAALKSTARDCTAVFGGVFVGPLSSNARRHGPAPRSAPFKTHYRPAAAARLSDNGTPLAAATVAVLQRQYRSGSITVAVLQRQYRSGSITVAVPQWQYHSGSTTVAVPQRQWQDELPSAPPEDSRVGGNWPVSKATLDNNEVISEFFFRYHSGYISRSSAPFQRPF